MRTALFAAALLAGTAAFAQDTTHNTDHSLTTPPGQAAATDANAVLTTTPAAPANATTMTTADGWAAGTGASVAPDNSNPERDARGIAVISDPAMVPAGYNGTGAAAVGGPLELAAGDNSYPPCSRSVTDNCLQTYERGRSPQ